MARRPNRFNSTTKRSREELVLKPSPNSAPKNQLQLIGQILHLIPGNSSFWTGFWAPFHALKLILSSAKLLSLVAVPLTINIALYSAFFVYGSKYLNTAVVDRATQLSVGWPQWLAVIAIFSTKLLAWFALGLVAAISFTLISGLTCAPFNDALSRAAYRRAMQKQAPELVILEPLSGSTVQTMILEFKRMSILIGGGIFAIILGFVPLLQIAALILGAFLVAFEYFGYPLSQRTHDLKPVFTFTLRNPGLSLGLGSFLLLLMAIPFASIVYIPLAVVASSELFAQLEIAARKKQQN